jgi:hypothetical protein
MSYPLSEISNANKTLYRALPFNPVVNSDGPIPRHFACALGTSRPALLHFRLIFIERRSLVHSLQITHCFYFHDNVYFREDSLSLPNSSSKRDVVKHVVDFQGARVKVTGLWLRIFVRVTLNFNVIKQGKESIVLMSWGLLTAGDRNE